MTGKMSDLLQTQLPARAVHPLLNAKGEPLHIGMFTDTYLPQINGIVTSVSGLTHALRQLGYRVTIVAPQHPKQQLEEGVFRVRATTYPPTPEQRMVLPPSIRKWARLRHLRFDMIHTHGAFPILGLAAARMFGLPLVHTYHTRMRDYVHYYPWYPYIEAFADDSKWYMSSRASDRIRTQLNRRSISMGERFDSWFSNRCNGLITPTQIIADELLEMGVRTRVDVVANGVDLSRLRVPRADPFTALNIPQGSRLLTVSRLAREKSVDVLLERMPALLKIRPDLKLVILGDGPDRPPLEQQALELGVQDSVVFVGYVANTEVGAYYQHADVFVFASVTETQGMVALEAASCGLPVVARAEGGIANSVADGLAGYLVPPEDAELFEQRVLELLEPSQHDQFAQNAVTWANSGSLEIMAERVLESYQKAQKHFEKRQAERRILNVLGVGEKTGE
jgi:1,2-diacylglycerol 3-alpha-glucosyltransferase